MNIFNKTNIIFFITVSLIYIGGFIYMYNKFDKKSEVNNIQEIEEIKVKTESDEIVIVPSKIKVDIKGSVKNPGVYELAEGLRVNDAIKLAGGLAKGANTRFINLSKKLNDGDVIVIYSNSEIEDAKKEKTIIVETPCVCEEVKNDACYNEVATQNDIKNNLNEKININTAGKEQLMTLYGIGESKADAIIEYRNNVSKFKKIEDIVNVSGISENSFNKIKENITV